MIDRTALTQPLTTGQRIVARLLRSYRIAGDVQVMLERELDQAIAAEREECARIADTGMLVPPDGGSPTQDEIDVAERIAAAIRNRT